MTTVDGQRASLDQILARLRRVEVACALLTTVALRQQLPSAVAPLLNEYADAIHAERGSAESDTEAGGAHVQKD